MTPPLAPPADMDNNLRANDDVLQRRLDSTDAKIDAVKKEINSLKSSLSPVSLRLKIKTQKRCYIEPETHKQTTFTSAFLATSTSLQRLQTRRN